VVHGQAEKMGMEHILVRITKRGIRHDQGSDGRREQHERSRRLTAEESQEHELSRMIVRRRASSRT
jgi:hypothetical protein